MKKWLAHKLFPSIEKEVTEKIIIQIKDKESLLRKDHWIAGCEQVFVLEDKRYYRFSDSDKIPLQRLERIQECIMLLDFKLNRDEFTTLIDLGMGAMQKAVDSFTEKKKMDCLLTASYALTEMKGRRDDLFFNPDLLMDLAAYSVVREDENPHEIDPVIHSDKFRLFKERSSEVDFFTKAGMTSYLPRWEELKEGWKAQWALHVSHQNSANKVYGNIRTEAGL